MDTCFLFTRHLDENGCFCLKITSDEILSAPFQKYSFPEIRDLQQNCKTLIVETTLNTNILELELPWVAERKARIAIPYALEEKLAQPVEELHFAFDKLRYQNNKYLIVVIDKQRLHYIIEKLITELIAFDGITIDWFALSPEELCINGDVLLINNTDFKGALSGDLAISYIKKHPFNALLLFKDSTIIPDNTPSSLEESSYKWIAQNLLKRKPLNLCQGEMQQGSTSNWIKKGYQLAALLFGFWLLSILLVNALSLYSLNKQTEEIDQQIAVIYREFFPEAKQIISPKFRISQLLENNSTQNDPRFWFLLNQFVEVTRNHPITVEQLRYQNKTLLLTLISNDFASLEDIENRLRKAHLKVNQTQASTHNQQVSATLELM